MHNSKSRRAHATMTGMAAILAQPQGCFTISLSNGQLVFEVQGTTVKEACSSHIAGYILLLSQPALLH